MAICASDLALGDFFLNRSPGEARSDEIADVGSFVPQVIEVEDRRIGLATVNTRMFKQIGTDEPLEDGSRIAAPLAHVGYVAPSVPNVPALRIKALTRETDPLASLSLERTKRKVRKWSCLATNAAPS